ncbi:MAG: CRISPR-associated endonuclease Cas1, partial [Saprospiraceae bacterium]
MQLILDTTGLTLQVKNKCFYLSKEKRSRLISPAKIDSIAVTASCTLSSQAVTLAARHQIPILFFNRMGQAEARLWSPWFSSLAELRRNQVLFNTSTSATAWVVHLFLEKLEGKAAILQWLKNRRPSQKLPLGETITAMHSFAAGYDEWKN